jgi:SNF2 family DNA or RNA helicase
MKISNEQILRIAANYFTYTRGVDYYNRGRVQYYKVNRNHREEQIDATVVGSKVYEVEVIIDEDSIKSYRCECDAYFSFTGACKHIVATLITHSLMSNHATVKQRVKEVTTTDPHASNLITAYRDQALNDVYSENAQTKVKLIPMINLDYADRFFLEFTLGHERQYILRDLQQFSYNMKEEKLVAYGKKLNLLHTLQSFDEESRPLVQLIISHYRHSLNDFHNPSSIDKRYLYLTNNALDDLFDIYQNRDMAFSAPEHRLFFEEGRPEIRLTIEQSKKDGFTIRLNPQPIAFIKTVYHSYLVFNDTLFRLDANYASKAGNLLKTFSHHKELVLNKTDIQAFFTNVLEEVKDYLILEMDEELREAYAPIPLTAKLYCDMPETNLIVGKLEFYYNELKVDPFEYKTHETMRNRKEEYIVLNILNTYFNYHEEAESTFYLDQDDAIYHFYKTGIDVMTGVIEFYATDKIKALVRKTPTVHIGVRVDHQLLDIDFDIEEFPMDELLDVLASYKKNSKYHRLKDGSFVELEDNALAELSQIMDGLDVTKQNLLDGELEVPKYRALYLDQIMKKSHSIVTERDASFKGMVRDINDVEDSHYEVPETFKKILRNYQKTGYRWLRTLGSYGFGGVLADDMGLGKTIQIISLLESYITETETPLIKPSLIVCPASLVLNWEMELKHFAPHMKVLPIIGTASERRELIQQINHYDVIITSYDYIKRDLENYDDFHFMYHVIDEAQYIKNHRTQNAKSVKQIKSEIRFALTGTPVENSLAEIWSIFDFVMPGYLYHYAKFSKDYEVPIVKNGDKLVLEKLRALVTPFVLRRLKKDVLKELPDKTETTLYVNLEGEQKKLYLANLALIKKDLKEQFDREGFNSSKLMVLAMLTRLRQLCCHPTLYYDEYKGESAKLDMCLELIQSSIDSGHKILLFSQFTSMLALIKEELIKLGIDYYLLEGSTKKEDRKAMVDQFNQDDTPIFLISLKAGGTGLNLTSADVVIHFDPWWNVSAQNQATDRAHRIGQKNNVTVYKLIAKNTIEEKILQLQASKQELSESIVVEDDGVITKMNQSEILNLFTE